MFTIEFFAIRPGVHVVHSETSDDLRLSDAETRAEKRLGELRHDNPHVEIDGYRIKDCSGSVVLRSPAA